MNQGRTRRRIVLLAVGAVAGLTVFTAGLSQASASIIAPQGGGVTKTPPAPLISTTTKIPLNSLFITTTKTPVAPRLIPTTSGFTAIVPNTGVINKAGGASARTTGNVIKTLKGMGYVKVGQNGSHAQYQKPGQPGKVTVPVHGSKNQVLPLGTYNSIFAQANANGKS